MSAVFAMSAASLVYLRLRKDCGSAAARVVAGLVPATSLMVAQCLPNGITTEEGCTAGGNLYPRLLDRRAAPVLLLREWQCRDVVDERRAGHAGRGCWNCSDGLVDPTATV